MSQSMARETENAKIRYNNEATYCQRGIPRNSSSMPGTWLIQKESSVWWL